MPSALPLRAWSLGVKLSELRVNLLYAAVSPNTQCDIRSWRGCGHHVSERVGIVYLSAVKSEYDVIGVEPCAIGRATRLDLNHKHALLILQLKLLSHI